MTSATLCIFAKPPVAGRAKTRLAADVGAPRAALLARSFLLDTCAAARALPWASAVLATTGPLEPALQSELALPCWSQGEGDLGARLERVLRRALLEAPIAIAIGADSPGLPPRLLQSARDALTHADAAIGPAADGGFYVLSVRSCPEGLLAELPWSAADTFGRTLERLRARGLSVTVLEPWFDVDTSADLERLTELIDAGAVSAPATCATLGAPRLSIIMPVLDEERIVARAIDDVLALQGRKEVIVVDGGSRDQTLAIARKKPVRVMEAPRGRARQMNAGAAAATGEVLLFLHADTTLPRDALVHVARTLSERAVIGGAFRTWTVADGDAPPWFSPLFSPLLHAADLRSRYTSLPYGDQAPFVRAEAFRRAGGFPDQPLMEDLELSRRLRRIGTLRTVPACVRVSGRRFLERPFFYAFVVNVFPALYYFGVSPERLATIYRSVR